MPTHRLARGAVSTMRSLLRADVFRLARSSWARGFVAAIPLLTVAQGLYYRWDNVRALDGWTRTVPALTGANGFLVNPGTVILVACLAIVTFVAFEREKGWDRTLLSSLCSRRTYVGEKCLFTAVVLAAALVWSTVWQLVGVAVSGCPVLSPETPLQIVAWLGTLWLAATVVLEVAVFVVLMVRSQIELAGVVTASFLYLGGVSDMVSVLIMVVSLALDFEAGGMVVAVLSEWAPSAILEALQSGATAALEVAEGAGSTITFGIPAALRAVIVCLPVALLACVAALRFASRKDL